MSDCSKSSRTGSDHSITITLEDETLSVDQAELDNVCVNDTVSWTCEDYPWAVQFIGEGGPGGFGRKTPPLSPLHLSGGAGESGSVTVQTNAEMHKVWDYVVAVSDGTSIYTLDPEIVIGSRP